MEEMFFLGLRKNSGISEADFLGKFGKTVDDISDILEEPVDKIQKICEISENYAPDYDAQKIYQELENSEY